MSDRVPFDDDELLADPVLRARLVLDDKAGPAARLPNARAHALVDAALQAALDPAALDLDSAADTAHALPSARPAARRPHLRTAAMAGAGILLLAFGAAAAVLVVRTFEPPAAPGAAPPAPVAHAPRPLTSAVAPEPAQEPEALPEPLPATAAPKPERAHEASERALDDLLQRANRERAAGRFAEAATVYAQVYRQNPSSLSAYVARVAAGSLELEHLDRPARARALFEAALRARPDGALDLEARQGLALSLRDLGAREHEITALRALIAAHPSRPAAARARARLTELQ